jgi:hypothetical protein
MRRFEVEPLVSHQRRMKYVHIWTGSSNTHPTVYTVSLFRAPFHPPLSTRKGRNEDQRCGVHEKFPPPKDFGHCDAACTAALELGGPDGRRRRYYIRAERSSSSFGITAEARAGSLSIVGRTLDLTLGLTLA